MEENRTACIMGHVEPTCQNVMVNIFGRLLQGHHMPPFCNLFLEGISFSPSGYRVPGVNADSPLHNRKDRKALTGTVHVRRGSMFSFRCFAKICGSSVNINHMLVQDFVFAQFGP